MGILSSKLNGSTLILIAAGVLTATILTSIYVGYAGTLLVCPGCNIPEMIHIDRYTIENNTSQQPALLTIWFNSTGPPGRSLTIEALYIEQAPMKYPGCHWIPYNESSCLTPFTVPNLKIPALSQVSVSIDTSSQGFYFTKGQNYGVDALTNQSWFGFQITYPSA